MSLANKGDLRLIADILGVSYQMMKKHALADDFPAPCDKIANVRVYDVSKVARYLGIPLNRA